MTKSIEIEIWEKSFILPIEYDCYEDEEITDEQLQILNQFISHPEWIEQSKFVVENYCKDQVIDDKNAKKDNIFSYVKPEYLFIKRDKKKPQVALMCKYRYDLEHGLAIVFSSDGKATVGIQDMIL